MHIWKWLAYTTLPLSAILTVEVTSATDPGVQTGHVVGSGGQAATAVPAGRVLQEERLSKYEINALLARAKPYPIPQLTTLPTEAHSLIDPLSRMSTQAPGVVSGNSGPDDSAETRREPAGEPDLSTRGAVSQSGITPFDYGLDNLDTVYHYTDRLLDTELNNDFPYRTVGWLRFVDAYGESFRCSAQLIARSIGLTAGHCVHVGGTQEAGWIRSGTFTPAYIDGEAPYGSAMVYWVNTTSGWYNSGDLDSGYDVGIFVLRNRTATTTELGTYTGYAGFCVTDCLQNYWFLSQLGYPGNYYDGAYMTQGEHLVISDTRDYLYGSGMQGGSSGGGHFANLGQLVTATAASQGSAPARNIIYAVTSWGFTDDAIKVQGASSLSGPNNSNNFKALFNDACTLSRSRHGPASCTLLP